MAKFKISANFINDQLKDLVLSDKTDSALKVINEGFDSQITMADVANLLAGKVRFIDNENEPGSFLLEKFEDKEYQEELDFMFAGRYQHIDGNWYEPHSHVYSSDIVDLCNYYVRGADQYKSFTEQNIASNKRHLAELYFDSIGLKYLCNYTDIDNNGTAHGYSSYVGWKQCTPPPFFYSKPHSTKDAIKQFLDAGKLTTLIDNGKRDIENKSYTCALLKDCPANSKIRQSIIESQDAEEEKFIAECKNIQVKVLAASKENIEIIYQDLDGKPVILNVPKEPFVAWCLEVERKRLLLTYDRNDMDRIKLFPICRWTSVSPDNFKLYGDVNFHTDWLIGAGLFHFNEDWYNNEQFKRVIYDEMDKIQNEYFGFEISVLCGNGIAVGEVCFPQPDEECYGKIAIIPTASPEYLSVALSARAVIVETGGKLTHLVNVARENNKIIVRVSGATEKFKINQVVEIDTIKGKLKIHT